MNNALFLLFKAPAGIRNRYEAARRTELMALSPKELCARVGGYGCRDETIMVEDLEGAEVSPTIKRSLQQLVYQSWQCDTQHLS